jgi:conjugation system TraG family ATPase
MDIDIILLIIAGIGVLVFFIFSGGKVNEEQEWSNIFPIQAIEKKCLVNWNDNLTVGFKVMLPEVYTMSVDEANGLHDRFINLIKLLPGGSVFHKQDFFYIDQHKSNFDSKSIVEIENQKLYHHRNVLKHYCNIYVTFRISERTKNKRSTLLKAIDSFNKTYTNIEKKLEEIENYIESFENGLNSISKIKAYRMNDEELGNSLDEYFNLSYAHGKGNYQDSTLPAYGFDKGYFKLGGEYISVISMIDEGKGLNTFKRADTQSGRIFNSGIDYNNEIELKTSMLFPVGLGLPINHILNVIIEVKENNKALMELDFESRKINFLASMGFARAKFKQEDIQDFRNTIEKYNYQASSTAVNVILHNDNKEQLNKDAGIVENAFANINQSAVYKENEEVANLFMLSCPGNVENYNDKRIFINTVDQAVSYITKETMYLDDVGGHVWGDRYGNPVVVDMWDNDLLVNRNMIVIGPSGTGKSYWINNYVNQILKKDGHVVLIDIGRSYERNILIHNGKYITADDKEKFRINFFLGEKDKYGNYKYYKSDDDDSEDFGNINFISTILSYMWKKKDKVSEYEKEIIEDMIRGYYEKVNQDKEIPKLKGFYAFIDKFKKEFNADLEQKNTFDFLTFKKVLKKYAIGDYAYIFDTEENLDVEKDKYVVFELETVKDDENIFPIMVLMIADLIVQKIEKLRGVQKVFGIDEALNFLKDPKMGPYIAYLYTTIRKKEGQVFIAAQNVEFLEVASKEIQTAIRSNTALYVLLDHSDYKSNYPAIQSIISLTDHDIEILDSIKNGKGYREFFLKMGSYSRIYRNEVSQFADKVYTSKEKDVKEIMDEFEKHHNMVLAVNQVLENKKLKV